MDQSVAAHYRIDLYAIDELERRILDDYDPARWGVGRFAGIDDVTERAVASDLLVSLCAGTKTASLDMALARERYEELLGPNGRTMPGPHTTLDDRIALARMEAASTECFRALGSALDCLAGLCVLIIGIPLNVQRAEGSWLLRRPQCPCAPTAQEQAWSSVAETVAFHANETEPGWLAWALENRNAVIHRGQLLRTWLNRPNTRGADQRKFIVTTNVPMRYLVRMEEHLRRRPWLPDMHALTKGGSVHELWLAEPAQVTLQHLQRRVTTLVARVAPLLGAIWDGPMRTFEWPSAAWRLTRRDAGWRIESAERFGGFEPGYPVPPPAEIRMHSDSAKRAGLAERLRSDL